MLGAVVIKRGQIAIPPELSASLPGLLEGSLLSSSAHLLPAKTCCALLRGTGEAGRKQFLCCKANTGGERQPRGLLCWVRLLQPMVKRAVCLPVSCKASCELSVVPGMAEGWSFLPDLWMILISLSYKAGDLIYPDLACITADRTGG